MFPRVSQLRLTQSSGIYLPDGIDRAQEMPYNIVRQFGLLQMGKRGPVPRGEYTNKSRVLSTRIREDTRAVLEEAARESGRSLSQEIEYRLRRSFDGDRIISEKFGSRQNYAVLRLLAALFDTAPREGRTWLNDPANFDHIRRSIMAVLDALRPTEAPEASDWDEFLGDLNAAALADELAVADASMPPEGAGNALNYIKADLGEAAGRLKSLEGSGMGYGERARKARRESGQ